ncbi:hypothetical protein Tco_1545463, partial [Tanacetum coccineum]
GSDADEGTGDIPGILDVPTYGSDDEQISWKSSEEDDEDEVNVNEKDDDNDNNDDDNADNQDDENPDEENQDDDDDEQTDSDNDGDDFVHPKFLTHDDEARQEEDSFDPRVQTPSNVETTDDEDDDEDDDEEVQGVNIEDETTNEAANNEEDEGNELYRDLNVNLEGSETVMTDASLPNVQATQETEDTHVILTALITPEGQQQSSSVSSGFVSNMLNPRPDTDFSEFKQRNQFAKAVSSIPNIVDNYLANKVNEAIKTAIQLQSDRLREDAQVENEDFLNKLDDNIKKIIKDQVKEQVKAQVSKILPKIEKLVNDQLESEVLIRSSNEAKTSHVVAANLSELELKKILIDKMEANKSIDRSDIQKNLYKALVDAYNADKDILDAYGDTVTIKRHRDDADDEEEPSARSNWGSKRRRSRKESEST